MQAQYLRRVHVPNPDAISVIQAGRLIEAFRERDRKRTTEVTLEVYRVEKAELEAARMATI